MGRTNTRGRQPADVVRTAAELGIAAAAQRLANTQDGAAAAHLPLPAVQEAVGFAFMHLCMTIPDDDTTEEQQSVRAALAKLCQLAENERTAAAAPAQSSGALRSTDAVADMRAPLSLALRDSGDPSHFEDEDQDMEQLPQEGIELISSRYLRTDSTQSQDVARQRRATAERRGLVRTMDSTVGRGGHWGSADILTDKGYDQLANIPTLRFVLWICQIATSCAKDEEGNSVAPVRRPLSWVLFATLATASGFLAWFAEDLNDTLLSFSYCMMGLSILGMYYSITQPVSGLQLMRMLGTIPRSQHSYVISSLERLWRIALVAAPLCGAFLGVSFTTYLSKLPNWANIAACVSVSISATIVQWTVILYQSIYLLHNVQFKAFARHVASRYSAARLSADFARLADLLQVTNRHASLPVSMVSLMWSVTGTALFFNFASNSNRADDFENTRYLWLVYALFFVGVAISLLAALARTSRVTREAQNTLHRYYVYRVREYDTEAEIRALKYVYWYVTYIIPSSSFGIRSCDIRSLAATFPSDSARAGRNTLRALHADSLETTHKSPVDAHPPPVALDLDLCDTAHLLS